jgi:hypothetical protein
MGMPERLACAMFAPQMIHLSGFATTHLYARVVFALKAM